MEPSNYSPQNINEYNSLLGPQAIRTQIDFDGSWEQFWHECLMLHPTIVTSFNSRCIGPSDLNVDMTRAIEPQQLTHSSGQRSLGPSEDFNWPSSEIGADMALLPASSLMDTSPTPSRSDPSTSNYSPSALSSRTSFSSPNSDTSPNSLSLAPENRFTCNFCPRSFLQNGLLNRHINTHTKPYKCSFRGCAKRQPTLRDLERHMNTHDPMSARLYICTEPECEYAVKGFQRKDHLKRHLRGKHPRLVP